MTPTSKERHDAALEAIGRKMATNRCKLWTATELAASTELPRIEVVAILKQLCDERKVFGHHREERVYIADPKWLDSLPVDYHVRT